MNKLFSQHAAKLLLSIILAFCALFSQSALAATAPANLLAGACHFSTTVQPSYPSMLNSVDGADCSTDPTPANHMVWLSLDAGTVNPVANTDYELAIFRHWVERAVVQIHYEDGHFQTYDAGRYDFDTYWSTGNFVTFKAPARGSPVSAILVGLQNPSSIKLFRQINFVKSESWADSVDMGRILTTAILGVLVAMLCYNLALAAVLRFNFHLHYCLFVFSVLAYNFFAYGHLAYFFPGTVSVGMQMNVTILSLGLNGLVGLYFLCSFLEQGILSKTWQAVAKGVGWLYLASAILYVSARGWHADTIDLWFNLMSAVGIVTIVATLTVALRQKSQAAIFILRVGSYLLPVFPFVFCGGLTSFHIPH